MSYENIDDGREMITRKQFKCEWCGEVIEKGSKAIMRKYKWVDELVNERQHIECYSALAESYAEGSILDDDGFETGEQLRGKSKNEVDRE